MSTPSSMVKWLCTWFGAGLSPIAPGTMGTLAALPFAWIIHAFTGPYGIFAASISIFFIGCWAAERYVNETGKKDPGEIVIDEVAGVWLLLAFLPHSFMGYAIGFAVFRFFDVLKPWPISLADRQVHGGVGVMLDDLLAGAYPVLIAYLALGLAQSF